MIKKSRKWLISGTLITALAILGGCKYHYNIDKSKPLMSSSYSEMVNDSIETVNKKRIYDSISSKRDNLFEANKAFEKYMLPFYKADVTRDKEKLIILFDNGTNRIYTDMDFNDDRNEFYCFRDYIKKINAYLISVNYYEGGEFKLINKSNGNFMDISGIPRISPNKSKFVIANLDLVSQYTTNGLWVYGIVNNEYVLEYEEKPENWGTNKIEWINENKILVYMNTIDENLDYIASGTFYLNYIDKHWVIADRKGI